MEQDRVKYLASRVTRKKYPPFLFHGRGVKLHKGYHCPSKFSSPSIESPLGSVARFYHRVIRSKKVAARGGSAKTGRQKGTFSGLKLSREKRGINKHAESGPTRDGDNHCGANVGKNL